MDPKIVGAFGVLSMCCICFSIAASMMGGEKEDPVVPTEPKPPPPVRTGGDQSWRDDNPGAVIADVSTECATPKTFDASVSYEGPSSDNYYNYCHEMVISQSSTCKTELCAVDNVYGACKDECNK